MIYQSATAITDFKHCDMLYYLRHVLRLRPAETPDSFRMGTNWHKCLEILTDPEGGRAAMIEHLNQAYEVCPPSVDLVDWGVERTVLLYSALGWEWHHQDDQIETIAREIPFSRQVNPMLARRGKIDRVVRRGEKLLLGEYKSTSKPIDSGSLYWDGLRLDSQVTLYLIEARHAQLAGELEQYGITSPNPDEPHCRFGVEAEGDPDPLISGVLYDVWHKPTIRPKKLTLAESKKFVATGEYFEEHFTIEDKEGLWVNGIMAEVTLGTTPKPTKKNPDPETPFAIRETPEMFGARLLDDIKKQPEKYFARRDIPRTDPELERFDEEYYNLARVAHIMTRHNLWFTNEHHCTATYRCSFYPICYYGQDVSNGNVPEGFRKV